MDLYLPASKQEKYDGYLLMKFFSCENFREEFLDGKIFFNTSDYFWNINKEGQSDQDEANELIISDNHEYKSMNFEVLNGKNCAVVRDYSKIPEKYVPSMIKSYSPARNRYRKIVCFYAAYLNTQKDIIQLPSEDMSKTFGEYVVIIPYRAEFFAKLENGIKNHLGIKEAQIGFVDYISENEIRGVYDWSPFKKKEKYISQNEVRATFIDNSTDVVKLDLKTNLRDIAFPVLWQDISEIYLKNGNLYYPIYECFD